MSKLITPFIILGIAFGVFLVGIKPLYEEVKGLRRDAASSDEAQEKAQDLIARRQTLINTKEKFSPEDLTKLQKMLPGNPDNIRLARDLDALAQRFSMTIRRVQAQIPDESQASTIGPADQGYGFADISFSLTGSYPSFVLFMQAVERNLRLLDTRQVTFTSGDKDIYEYQVVLRTYWIK